MVVGEFVEWEGPMKLITAVIRADRLETVIGAAVAAGARGVTAADVRGFGQQLGHAGAAHAAEHPVLLPKVRLDLVVADGAADGITDAIVKAAVTHEVGDGKIWISPVDDVVRIRTGESGSAAVAESPRGGSR